MKEKTKANPFGISEAHRVLFSPGVQLRITMAILLCLFAVIVPMMLPLGSFLLLPVSLLVALPMIFGLIYMGKRVSDGEDLSVKDVFYAFSGRRYWYALSSMLLWLFLWLIPILPVIAFSVGATVFYSACVRDGESATVLTLVILCALIATVLLTLCLLFLALPAYLFLPIRVREPHTNAFRAIGLSFRLLRGNVLRLWRLQFKYVGLILLSVVSVFTLFPIYTLPLMLVASSSHVRVLSEAKGSSQEIILTQIEDSK